MHSSTVYFIAINISDVTKYAHVKVLGTEEEIHVAIWIVSSEVKQTAKIMVWIPFVGLRQLAYWDRASQQSRWK